MNARHSRILFVDDNEDDHVLFQNALRRRGLTLDFLHPLYDGAEAIDYLTGAGDYADRARYPWPDLVILDLKMPAKSGHDVLAWLQTCPSPPVTVVFSGSDRHQDISLANALGARDYFVKPCDWQEWTKLVGAILEHCSSSATKRG